MWTARVRVLIRNPSNSQKLIIVCLVLQIAALLVQLPLLSRPGYFNALSGDLNLYYQYSSNIFHGMIPYQDFTMEYPPLVLIPICFPFGITWNLSMSFQMYIALFLLENIVLCLVIGRIVWYIQQRWEPNPHHNLISLMVYSLVICIASPLLAWRYDIFPALLTIMALWLLLLNKPFLSGFSLGIASAAKLYPVMLIPVFGIYLWTHQKKQSLGFLVSGILVVLVILLPLFFFSPEWLVKFVNYHQLRGIQIESFVSGVLLIGHLIGSVPITVGLNYGAFHIVSAYSGIILQIVPVFAILVFSIILVSAFLAFQKEYRLKGSNSSETLVAYSVLILLGFIILNKVFSPQYIIWLIPFVPLLKYRYSLFMPIIALLTIAIFPVFYSALLHLHYGGIILLNLRNLVVIILFIRLFHDYSPFKKNVFDSFR